MVKPYILLEVGIAANTKSRSVTSFNLVYTMFILQIISFRLPKKENWIVQFNKVYNPNIVTQKSTILRFFAEFN